ncbi:MAG: NAD(P)-dependent oxidoreductase [Candidatus Pelagibacter bacterium]|nr:NAD(P)-dependent oxidoreductase [Candidatus Pelagibacter bacterium]MBL6861210.1 NAD(P)-dependent oxidoreductase [Candidatus Pelagibacter bacterium]
MKKVSKQIIGITGSKGALGSQFIKKYKTKFNFRIYNDRVENKKKFEQWLNNNLDIKYFIHLAAISSVYATNRNSKKTYKINSAATINIIKKLNKTKLSNFKYFLFSSSSHVYKPSLKNLVENSNRNPSTIYGKSKKRVEDYIIKNHKKIKFKIGIARIFNFYSAKHKKGFFIQDIKKKMKSKNKILTIKKINTCRDYIDLNQLCEIIFFMLNKRISTSINVGSGKKINLINLIEIIKNKYGFKKKLNYEKKVYPGLFANINLLRKLGYKKRIVKFKFK